MERPKMYASALFIAAAIFCVLTFSPEAQAGGIDFHIGINLPFPGVVVAPPVAYAPPPVVVVPPPYVYQRPVVPHHYDYYRPHHARPNSWEHSGYSGHTRERERRW